MSTLVAILAAFAIRDSGEWAWKRWRQKRRSAKNLAGALRFLESHPEWRQPPL